MDELLKQRIRTLGRLSVNGGVTLVTHSGLFHADEVVGVALLERLLDKCPVIRTRQLPVTGNNLLLDIGEGLFDHHGPALARNGEFVPGVPHSAASLIYTPLVEMGVVPGGDGPLKAAIVAIAAQDNGGDIPKGYHHPFGCIPAFNPAWDEPREAADLRFQEALATARVLLDQLIRQQEAANKAEHLIDALPPDRVVILPAVGLPWLKKLAAPNSITEFVVFLGDNNTWFCQCVPLSADQPMSKRIPFPAAWAGKRDAELSAVSGIPGGVFCHAGSFLSGWNTREAAIEAAAKAKAAL